MVVDPLRGLSFRPLGPKGAPYPPWMEVMRGQSGVYVIASAETGETLYVGESHSCRLFETCTRHFQVWKDPTGNGGKEHVWHRTYPRESCVVAFWIRKPRDAVTAQNSLIEILTPRDNAFRPGQKGMKLSDKDAEQIRASKESSAVLARHYKVDPSVIRRVRLNQIKRNTHVE